MKKTLVSAALAAPLLIVGVDAQAIAYSGQSLTSQSGTASYYSDRFHGRLTASGARYDKNGLSAAHRSLPLGTQVRVTNTSSGESVVVQVNDRGPFHRSRIIDLSRAAAREIGLVRSGTAHVKLDILSKSYNNLDGEIF